MENENIVPENNENVAVQVDNQPPKKDNKKLIIIGIIALAVIGVIVYLVLTSNKKEEENQTNTTTEQKQKDKKDKTKEETLTKDSVVVKELFDAFREDDLRVNNNLSFLENKEDLMLYYALKNVKEDAFEEGIKLKSDYNYKNNLVSYLSNDYKQKHNYKYNGQFFREEKVEEVYKKLFGKDSKINHKHLEVYGRYDYYYDSKNRIYVVFEQTPGAQFTEFDRQEIIRIEQNSDELKIITKAYDTYEEYVYDIIYTFNYESETGNWIYVDREDEFESFDPYLVKASYNKMESPFEDNTSKYNNTIKELFNSFREDEDELLYTIASKKDWDEYKHYITVRSIDSKYKSTIKCTDLDVVFDVYKKYETEFICGDPWATHDYYDNGKKAKNYTQEDIKKKLNNYSVETFNATAYVNHYNKLFGKNSIKKESTLYEYIYMLYYDNKRDLFEVFSFEGGNETVGPLDGQRIVDVVETEKTLQIKTEGIHDGVSDYSIEKINYSFVKEDSTGNWVFKSREMK